MKGYRSKATPPRPSQGRGMKVNGPLGPRGRFSCAPQVLRCKAKSKAKRLKELIIYDEGGQIGSNKVRFMHFLAHSEPIIE